MTQVALVGAGVIGRGWAAQLLSRGCAVTIADPRTTLSEVVDYVNRTRPSVEVLGGDLNGFESRLRLTRDLREAVAGATWVQENGPEPFSEKSELIATLDELVPTDVVIASSSSGTMPTALSNACTRAPGRVVIGHPFNPVELIPLVEVVKGAQTTAEVGERAMAFYRSVGKRPVLVRQEVPGHLANRLQAALWREAYSLVQRGVATVADVDAAIADGPGLRWALLGPLVNQHLSGGDGGLAHVLEHLGPPTQAWMDDLREVQLDPDLARKLVAGVDEELAEVDQDALVAQRDELLVGLLLAKQQAMALP